MAMPVPSFWPVSRGEELVPQRKMDRNEEGTTTTTNWLRRMLKKRWSNQLQI